MRRKREQKAKRSIAQLIVVLIMGGLIGSIIGEVVAEFYPSSNSLMHRVFVSGITPVLEPGEIKLYVIDLTIGITLRLNLCSALGIILAGYAYRFF